VKAIHYSLRFIALPLALTAMRAEAQTPPPPAAPAEPAPAPAPATPPAEAAAPAPAEAPPAEPVEAPEPAAEPAPPEPAPEPAPPAVEEKAAEAAAAATADVPEAPPSLGPLTFGTSTWSRFEVREGYDRLGVSPPAIVNPLRTRFTEGDQTVFRARLAMATADLPLGPKLTGMVQFSPQASGTWGTSGLNGTVGEAALGIYEGYFKFKGERFELKGGRFAMNYGEALVIGNLDWHQAGRAFDGLHTKYKMNKGYVDLFGTQTASGWGTGATDPFLAGDTYFWGLYSGWGGYIKEGLDLDLYLLGLSVASNETATATDAATGTAFTYQRDGATLLTLGARAKQKLGMFDYRLEGGFQFGESAGAAPTDATITQVGAATALAYQVEGEIGFGFTKKLRLGIGGSIASGNDPATPENEAYNELFPTTHKWHGLMDIIGQRTNVGRGFFKFSAGLGETVTFLLDGHIFARPAAGGLGRDPMSTSGLAGGEFDVQLVKKFGKWGTLRGLYGIFLANGDHYVTDEAAHYVEIQGGIDF